jgi:hypothetical protein
LDSLVKKTRLPTEKNDLQEEIKDEVKDKKTTNSPDWDKVIYDIVQTNSHKFSVKYSQKSDIIGEEEWVDGEMNTLSNIGSHKKEKKNNTQSLLGDHSTHNKKAKKKGTECVCVCFWPPVTKWGTVMHEIPISSPPSR